MLWYCSDNGALPKVGSAGGRRGNKASDLRGRVARAGAARVAGAVSRSPRVIDVPCVTSDIYPTVLEWTGAKADRQPPLDGVSLVPLLDGKASGAAKPIGFWDHPTPGVGTPSKEWMDELLAEQKAGREPNDPKKLFADAGKIGTQVPARQVPRALRLARRVVEAAPDREPEGRGGEVGTVRPRGRSEGVARPARGRAEAGRGDEEGTDRVARVGGAEPQRRRLPGEVTSFGGAIVTCSLSVFAALLPAPAAAALPSPLAGKRPNIIFVLTDDQGYGDLSCHGNPVLKTPNLDRLHAEGVRFTDFHVSPTCSPDALGPADRPARVQERRHAHHPRARAADAQGDHARPGAARPPATRPASSASGTSATSPTDRPDNRGFDEMFIHGGGGIGQTYPGSCGDAPGNTYFDPAILHNGKFEKTEGLLHRRLLRPGARSGSSR